MSRKVTQHLERLVADGLSDSAEALPLTPPLYQRGILPQLSPEASSCFQELNASEWSPIFGGGFELRCFQLLSATARLLGSALPDNR